MLKADVRKDDVENIGQGGKNVENWMVETQNLRKYYQLGANTVKALDGVDFRYSITILS